MYNKFEGLIDLLVYFQKERIIDGAQTPLKRTIATNKCRILDNQVNAIKGLNAFFRENNYQKALFYWRLIK